MKLQRRKNEYQYLYKKGEESKDDNITVENGSCRIW